MPVGYDIGSVGVVLPGIEVKIGEDNEILLRGKTITKGYYKKAEATAKAIFTGGDAANMPTAKLEADSFTDDEIDAINLVFGAGLATTKSEARRTIQQGGVSVDGEKVADIAAKFPKSMFEGDGVVVKKGKKSFVKVSVN